VGKGVTERTEQEMECLDSWNLTNKLDLGAFQIPEDDEGKGSCSHEDPDLRDNEGAGSDVIADTGMKGTDQWTADQILQSGVVLCNNVKGAGRKAGLGKEARKQVEGPALRLPLG
jgi:hypothetical protein